MSPYFIAPDSTQDPWGYQAWCRKYALHLLQQSPPRFGGKAKDTTGGRGYLSKIYVENFGIGGTYSTGDQALPFLNGAVRNSEKIRINTLENLLTNSHMSLEAPDEDSYIGRLYQESSGKIKGQVTYFDLVGRLRQNFINAQVNFGQGEIALSEDDAQNISFWMNYVVQETNTLRELEKPIEIKQNEDFFRQYWALEPVLKPKVDEQVHQLGLDAIASQDESQLRIQNSIIGMYMLSRAIATAYQVDTIA
ncbi:hypothetical protein JXB41_07535 [Candidatus Woesearchaeota archaeon]|nr:hypothetical protein [Candidatus Woesearchaeota archaeon]